MPFQLPLCRYIHGTEKTSTPQNRLGVLQWVLTRPMYRFQRFDLGQVPPKNRAQALRLKLAQWTPFASSAYYVGWEGQHALVWGWDSDKVQQAIVAQGIKPKRVKILPESLLQNPIESGLQLVLCQEGFEGQFWHGGQLERSRWWPQMPKPDEWLMFQRDAGIPPNQQQDKPPAPHSRPLNARPWVYETSASGGLGTQWERIIVALGILLLSAPTFWYGFGQYKLQLDTEILFDRQSQLQRKAAPIMQARRESLDHLFRINELRAISPYPGQLELMAGVAKVLPQDQSYLKDWDFQSGQLKITISSASDISTTSLIGALQKAGFFRDVKALPGRDPKSVTFQMEVIGG